MTNEELERHLRKVATKKVRLQNAKDKLAHLLLIETPDNHTLGSIQHHRDRIRILRRMLRPKKAKK